MLKKITEKAPVAFSVWKMYILISIKIVLNFPGGGVDKNLPAHAGDTDSIPGPGRVHMLQSNQAQVPQLLSLSSRAGEQQLQRLCALNSVLHSKRSQHNEKPQRKAAPRSPQLDKACAVTDSKLIA